MTVPRMRFTFWKAVFLVIMVAGIYCTFIRFFRGLGASTNLSDQFPWGLWIGFDVMCGVMLAAGGFTLTAAVEIFNIKRFHSIIRPTILTAFLGYLLVCSGAGKALSLRLEAFSSGKAWSGGRFSAPACAARRGSKVVSLAINDAQLSLVAVCLIIARLRTSTGASRLKFGGTQNGRQFQH